LIARLLARVGLVTPEQRAWAWYDWANSAYFTTVVTAVFPAFFATYAASALEPAQATARFGAITSFSVGLVAVLSPILGAIADYTGTRKRLLAAFIFVGVAACAAMVFIGEGDWRLAATLPHAHEPAFYERPQFIALRAQPDIDRGVVFHRRWEAKDAVHGSSSIGTRQGR